MKRAIISFVTILIITLGLSDCRSIPEGVSAVDGIDINNYAGVWYEIARMDNRFEKNLTDVTATYTRQDDGMIKVVNRGYDTVKNKWVDVEGKARAADKQNNAKLEVSFFGPFYSGYNVIAIDREQYGYSLISGSNREYLWILSRIPYLPDEKIVELKSQAAGVGFDTSKLIMVTYNRSDLLLE